MMVMMTMMTMTMMMTMMTVEMREEVPDPGPCNGRFCGPHIALEDPSICIVDEINMPVLNGRHAPWNSNPALSTPKSKRHSLYYWWATYVFGVRGRYNRLVLPLCVVYAIRNKYPNPLGEVYVGFDHAH